MFTKIKEKKNIIPVLGDAKSKFGLQHENQRIKPRDSYSNIDEAKWVEENKI